MRHTISVLVENKFGVLARVAGLFSGRGYNIDSLNVGETEDPTISRMTIVAKGDERILDQIMKQLDRLVDVVKVIDLTKDEMIGILEKLVDLRVKVIDFRDTLSLGEQE